MKKDHRNELKSCIQAVQISISHLQREMVFFRKDIEKRPKLDEEYLEIAKGFRKLAQAIEDSVNQEDE